MSRRSPNAPARSGKHPDMPRTAPKPGHGLVSLPRALSKLGLCSRTEAVTLIEAGRICIDGRAIRSLTYRVDMDRARISFDGRPIIPERPIYLMLNKPRGLVTTRRDPAQRDTVYDCLPPGLPFLSPVGRLDKASEGLLFFTNDTGWAEYLLNPASRIAKTYHVKIDRPADPVFLAALSQPVQADGEWLGAQAVRLLRASSRSSWIEIILTEGRNRQVRRMVVAGGASVLRLVRVAIGGIILGELPKRETRILNAPERDRIQRPAAASGFSAAAHRKA